ncbi:MAG: MBL fold metallo-hydrolase [Thermoproteota archaeon]|nr:MBL fold metallo-hydrolase [Candidatus Brockarchaeota archaeon]MBO3800944.1 MBL fold metallo-hydrolase [Candidatus Brockarchaeota archaeon]
MKGKKMQEISLKRNQLLYSLINKYSGVILRSPMYTVVVDPTLEEIDESKLANVDLILITHEHEHHLDENAVSRIIKSYKKPKETFSEESKIIEVITQTEQADDEKKETTKERETESAEEGPLVVCNMASAVLVKHIVPRGNLKILRPGDEFNHEMITIKAFESNHPSATSPLTYLIVFENGVKIYHASDSMPNEDMKKIGVNEKPDIAFVPIGLDPGINYKVGVEITLRVMPKLVIPYHGTEFKRFENEMKKKRPDIRIDIKKIGEVGIYE